MLKHTNYARYPAPADVVIKMFTDKNFHTAKLEAMGMVKFEVVSHHFENGEFQIKIDRRVPLQAPGVVKKVVSAETRVVNEEFWSVASKTGRVEVEPVGMPIEMRCQTRIEDVGEQSCTVTFDWEIHSKMPLMGASLEKYVVQDIENRAADETRVAISLLDKYR